jgi:hypothetical protein
MYVCRGEGGWIKTSKRIAIRTTAFEKKGPPIQKAADEEQFSVLFFFDFFDMLALSPFQLVHLWLRGRKRERLGKKRKKDQEVYISM